VAAFDRRIVAWTHYFAQVDEALRQAGVKKVDIDGNGGVADITVMAEQALLDVLLSRADHGGAADDDDGWGEDPSTTTSSSTTPSTADDLSISITPCETIPVSKTTPFSVNVCVSIDVPLPSPENPRTPCDIVCVVDVSGSMGNPATVESPDGSVNTSNGLTILNLVQHSIRSVMHMVGEGDRIAIVTFNGKASRVLELTYMDEAGREKATEVHTV